MRRGVSHLVVALRWLQIAEGFRSRARVLRYFGANRDANAENYANAKEAVRIARRCLEERWATGQR